MISDGAIGPLRTRSRSLIQTQLRKLLEDACPKYRRKRWHPQLANIYSNLLKVSPALSTFTTIAQNRNAWFTTGLHTRQPHP
jgi:hypothetical protein